MDDRQRALPPRNRLPVLGAGASLWRGSKGVGPFTFLETKTIISAVTSRADGSGGSSSTADIPAEKYGRTSARSRDGPLSGVRALITRNSFSESFRQRETEQLLVVSATSGSTSLRGSEPALAADAHGGYRSNPFLTGGEGIASLVIPPIGSATGYEKVLK